jgi:hypothetical protein
MQKLNMMLILHLMLYLMHQQLQHLDFIKEIKDILEIILHRNMIIVLQEFLYLMINKN